MRLLNAKKIEILAEADKDVRGRRMLHVRCFCGVEKIVVRDSFLRNKTESCGCVRAERVKIACARIKRKTYTVDGVTKSLVSWAIEHDIPKTTLRYRMTRGMSMREALDVTREGSDSILDARK